MDERDSSNPVIVNEAFVKSVGWENPIGQQFINMDDRRTMTVIGLIKDYHYGSLKEKIGPQVLSLGNREYVIIKIQTGKIVQALPVIEKIFKKTFPQHYFNYTFLVDEISNAYQSDKNWQQIITFSAGLAIFICMVGLFGLSTFAAQERIKEIGVRKVLGASVAGIASLLVKDFLQLVLVAIILASPVAWFIMNKWLQDFAYRINISWRVFVLAGLAAMLIAFITVSTQAVKAGLANPAESLRSN
jgi:ABC-type antimicrobial peptide transport system permease subunit